MHDVLSVEERERRQIVFGELMKGKTKTGKLCDRGLEEASQVCMEATAV